MQSQSQLPKVSARARFVRVSARARFFPENESLGSASKTKVSAQHQKLGIIYITSGHLVDIDRVDITMTVDKPVYPWVRGW